MSLGVVVVGGIGFAVLAALLVPWDWVPGGHLVHVAPGAVFSHSEIQHAEAYSGLQREIGWASYGVSLVVVLLLGLTRAGRRLVGWMPGWWWVRVALGTLLILLIGFLVAVPFGWWAHRRSVDFGLSNQDAGGWWRDQLVSLGVSWVFTCIGMLVLVALARWLPRSWPVWAAVLSVLLGALASFVYPVAVEPLFNDFKPLPHGHLRSQILRLADIEGVHVSDVLVADASRQTTTLNAYVSGFGSTRRVVLYDTLLRDTPRPELLLVVAHELGHAKNRDVLEGTVLGVAGGAAGVGLLGLLLSSGWLLRRSGERDADDAGGDGSPVRRGAADPGVVPLVLALVAVGSLLSSPVQNAISRDVEARADRASLVATGDYKDFVTLQRRLAVASLADPTPPRWSQFWFATHPTALQRIGIAKALRK